VLVVVFLTTWGLFKTWSPVFWKKTDYFYFLFTIVGAATGATDLAISNWNKEVQHSQIDMLSLRGDITTEAGNVSAGCDRQAAAEKLAKSSSPDIIVPRDNYESPEKIPIPEIIKPRSYDFNNITKNDCAIVEAIFDALRVGSIDSVLELAAVQLILSEMNTMAPTERLERYIFLKQDMVSEKELLVPGETQTVIISHVYMMDIISKIKLLVEEHSSSERLQRNINDLGGIAILKNLSPILLGLGLGIRLARTHYDVVAEMKKAKTSAS